MFAHLRKGSFGWNVCLVIEQVNNRVGGFAEGGAGVRLDKSAVAVGQGVGTGDACSAFVFFFYERFCEGRGIKP